MLGYCFFSLGNFYFFCFLVAAKWQTLIEWVEREGVAVIYCPISIYLGEKKGKGFTCILSF